MDAVTALKNALDRELPSLPAVGIKGMMVAEVMPTEVQSSSLHQCQYLKLPVSPMASIDTLKGNRERVGKFFTFIFEQIHSPSISWFVRPQCRCHDPLDRGGFND